jgi:hypothetical protein
MARFVNGPQVSGKWNPAGGPVDVPGRDATITQFALTNTADGVDAQLTIEAFSPDLVRPVALHCYIAEGPLNADPGAFLADPAVIKGSATVADGNDAYGIPLRGLTEGVRKVFQTVLEFAS